MATSPYPDGVGFALRACLEPWTTISQVLLTEVLKRAFQRQGLEYVSVGGFFYEGTLVQCLEVSDRAHVIRTIRELFEELGFDSGLEIAYFDYAENFWRPVFPPNAQPFDRHLRPDKLEQARIYCEALHKEVERLKGLSKPSEPSPGC